MSLCSFTADASGLLIFFRILLYSLCLRHQRVPMRNCENNTEIYFVETQ